MCVKTGTLLRPTTLYCCTFSKGGNKVQGEIIGEIIGWRNGWGFFLVHSRTYLWCIQNSCIFVHMKIKTNYNSHEKRIHYRYRKAKLKEEIVLIIMIYITFRLLFFGPSLLAMCYVSENGGQKNFHMHIIF